MSQLQPPAPESAQADRVADQLRRISQKLEAAQMQLAARWIAEEQKGKQQHGIVEGLEGQLQNIEQQVTAVVAAVCHGREPSVVEHELQSKLHKMQSERDHYKQVIC